MLFTKLCSGFHSALRFLQLSSIWFSFLANRTNLFEWPVSQHVLRVTVVVWRRVVAVNGGGAGATSLVVLMLVLVVLMLVLVLVQVLVAVAVVLVVNDDDDDDDMNFCSVHYVPWPHSAYVVLND